MDFIEGFIREIDDLLVNLLFKLVLIKTTESFQFDLVPTLVTSLLWCAKRLQRVYTISSYLVNHTLTSNYNYTQD